MKDNLKLRIVLQGGRFGRIEAAKLVAAFNTGIIGAMCIS